MTADDALAARFQEHRAHLHAVSARMLGSGAEADDAVQEAWVRLARSDADAIGNLRAWLTTVVARVCLNMLRARDTRREDPLGEDDHLPDPVIEDPEAQALAADAVSAALVVVLETLAPDERLAFVLHDLFAVGFDEIAPLVDRTPAAARQLASRARHRVQGAPPGVDADPAARRRVVTAFLAAARDGDLAGLVATLHPDIVLRADTTSTAPLRRVRGPQAVARQAARFGRPDTVSHPACVNGGPGQVSFRGGRPVSVLAFTVEDGQIVAIDVLADRERLARMDLAQFVP